jgi:hypothetical protein
MRVGVCPIARYGVKERLLTQYLVINNAPPRTVWYEALAFLMCEKQLAF